MLARQHICRRLSWPALQLVMCLMASWGIQSGLSACSTPATYYECPTALEAAQFLVGANSPLEISNATWTPSSCPSTANVGTAGTVPTRIRITDFSCHALAGSMPQGALVLSNGDASAAADVTNDGNSNYGFSYAGQDPDMKTIAGTATLWDTLDLTFDVTSWGTGKVYFQYVFGSDEYPEYAPPKSTAGYNDIFAFFMWASASDPHANVALLPNSSTAVSIGSINPSINTEWYTSNTIGGTATGYPGPHANAMDGYTVLMNTSTHSLTAGTTYHIKLAIADMLDAKYDSNVWIKQGSLQFVTPPVANCSGVWTNWTSCSANCSGGTTSSTYIWKWPASGGGINCTIANNTVNTTSCNTQHCPVNCVGNWTAWTSCSKACGGGTSNSTFLVTTPAAYGGTNCSFANNLVNSTSCNTQPCPVNCVGNWTATTNCSKTCGNGTQNTTYIITTAAANGGANCSFTNNTINTTSCNTQPCPVNCVGNWTPWTNCSKACGGGTTNSTFVVATPAANGGTCTVANNTVNTTSCNTQACPPVNCVANWLNTSSCNQSCGGGSLTQTYVITTPATYNGTSCTTTNGSTRAVACNTQACPPVNCVANWVNTTTCNQSCGGGTLTQTYVITTQAANGGTSCAAVNGTTQTVACNTQACPPVNCVANWVNTSSCNQSCGGGTLTQTYIITTPAAYNGTNCTTTNGSTRAVACNTQACPPVNCVANWVNTSSCNQSCGGGTLTQTYVITTPAAYNGTNCTTINGSTRAVACNTQACPPVNCVANWVNTSSCNQSCGGGTLTQTYIITTPAAYNGTNCTTSNGSTRAVACNTQACVQVNCVANWVNTTTCNQSSGGGTLTQTYVITTQAANGGTSCATVNGTTQTVACNTQACPPVNCVANWVNTSSCNQSCGGGTLTQTYIITIPAAYNGTNCTTTNGSTRAVACNTQACVPVNCVANWVNTTTCNQSCGGGTLTQTYVITTQAANGGTSCATVNGTIQTVACNTQSCPPVNCVANWVNTSSCNQPCGGGTLTQTYIITTHAAYNGTNCTTANGSTRAVACNTQACMPVNCVATWLNTSGCNQSCGGGTLTQTYVVTTQATNGGTSCVAVNGTTQTVDCHTQACVPVNCVATWLNTSGCNQSCGGGTLTQTYGITTPAAYNGTNCTATNGSTRAVACNTDACVPVNCVANWVNTTTCNQSCGGGTLTQTYVITTQAANGGTICAAVNGTTQTVACNTQACPPVNCVANWVNTSSCNQSCGGGTLTQTYIITTPAAYNGTNCTTTNGSTRAVACNTQACPPVNCVANWLNTSSCNQSCGGGTLIQSYVITTHAAYNGTNCTTTNGSISAVACNTQACSPINCVANWVNTSSCNQSCGGGTLTQTYVITTPAAFNGTSCIAANGTTQPVACNTEDCTPTDCVGSLVNTTDCDQPCGGGTVTQTYVITTPAAYNGSYCATANGTTQPASCNTHACTPGPIDCVGSWVNTTDCDQPCGGGTLTQTYVITTPATYNGSDCATANGTTQPASCNPHDCTPGPIDCVSSWVNTTYCDQPCGGGTLTQTYVITTPAAYNGTDCATTNGTTQPLACNTQDCTPIHCVGSWVNTTDCDQPCGGGTLNQTYLITTPAAHNGTDCATSNGTTQSMACNTRDCTPTDCVGSWVNTTACDQPCEGGTLTQTYVITIPEAHNGTDCATSNGTTQSMACNTQACTPIACVGSWLNTTDCDQPCGGGTLNQTCVITTPAAYSGADCATAGGTTQQVACNTQDCTAVDCVGSWVNTTDCDQPCGGGTLTQTYVITTPVAYNGTDCATNNGTTQPEACNTQNCTAVDCVGSWVSTTDCDRPCGGGLLTQTYVVTTPAAYNGTGCATANGVTQTVDCNTQACRPVDCFGSWADTTDCDQPCGGGTLTQTFVVTTQATDNGVDCATANGTTQVAACNTQDCTAVDCGGSWVNTTDCDQPCGGGSLTQTYVITTPVAYNGTDCATSNGVTQTMDCNTQACRPVDCFGSWADTTDCDQPCGGGTLTQTFVVTTQATDNGVDCATANGTTQAAACNTQDCTAVDCVGSWVNTTDCDQPCGGGTLSQTYVVTTAAAYNGTDCATPNGTTGPSACNTHACPLLSPVLASPSSGSPSPVVSSPSPSPSPSLVSPQPSPPSSPAAVPSPTTSPSLGASPSPSPAAHSPSPRPSPRPSPSPSPHPPSSPSPHPSPSPSPSPNPPLSPDPVPSKINETVLQQIPYYISPPVLPPLPAMNDSNITIRGGNVTIIGVKSAAGGMPVANSDEATPPSPAATGAALPQTNLTWRSAAFNGSLGFYTLGVTTTVYGEFVLQRTMNWTWSTQYSAWTTDVSLQGQLVLTRVVETNGQETSSETLNPAVSGLLTLFNSKYPGPGFSGTYDWAGLLPMVPDPFAYWGITSLGSRRLMAVPEAVERGQCCPTIPGRLLLSTDGNTPVQGRVSVREVASKAMSNTASSLGQSSAADDEISVTRPVTDGATGTGGTTSYSSSPFQAFIAALSDPKNSKFVILAAVLAPTGLAVCVGSIIGAVLYRKRRRKEDEQKKQRQKLKDEQDAGAQTVASAAVVHGSTATSSAVPARKTARRRTGTVRGMGAAQFRSSSGGGGGGGGGGADGSSGLPGGGTYGSSHIEFLDPADASQFASFTGYNLRGRKQRASLSGPTPIEGAEDDQVLRFDPVDSSLSGGGVETSRNPPGKQRGRFGSITGSIAGMASSIAGAINHFRHSQTGQAYKVHDHDSGLTSPRSTVELPRESRERGPTLPGSAGTGRGSLDLGRQGYLDLNAYPGQKATVDWGIAGVFKVTPPNSARPNKADPTPNISSKDSSSSCCYCYCSQTAARSSQVSAGSVDAAHL